MSEPMSPEIKRDDVDERQVLQLRYQALAYKYLLRNMAIPPHIERSILSVTKEQWESERERLFQNSLKYYQAKIEKNDDFKQMIRDRFHRKTNE